jgi:hypothetical protein
MSSWPFAVVAIDLFPSEWEIDPESRLNQDHFTRNQCPQSAKAGISLPRSFQIPAFAGIAAAFRPVTAQYDAT